MCRRVCQGITESFKSVQCPSECGSGARVYPMSVSVLNTIFPYAFGFDASLGSIQAGFR